jgi:pimeloyl-ACP methyl ester carboxylesterase
MKDTGPTSHSFISQRLRLHYVDWGNPDAPPLILQHGGRDHSRSWDWAAQELRKDWHVICPDLRGHGDSAWSPDGDYTLHAYVYDFAQLVHSLGYDQVSIVGHSLGGVVSTFYTATFPEKVKQFVSVEGIGPTSQWFERRAETPLTEQMRNWIADKRSAAGRTPRRYPTLRAAYARMKEENAFLTDDQARHLTIHGASRNEDGTWSWKFDNYVNVVTPANPGEAEFRKMWSAIACPVLLIFGTESFLTDPSKDGRLEYFRDARQKMYENAGHWLHHDQFDRFMGDVTGFLTRS